MFVDAGFLWGGLFEKSSRITGTGKLFPDFFYAFGEIRDAIRRQYHAAEIAIVWYDAPHPVTNIDVLAAEEAGAVVRLGILTTDHRQKCVDTLLTSDLVTCAFEKTIDCAVLYSGDLDFLPAMERCRQQSFPVALMVDYHSDILSSQLLRAAHGVVPVSFEPRKFLPEVTSRSKRAVVAKIIARDCFQRIEATNKKRLMEGADNAGIDVRGILYSALSRALRGKLSVTDKIAIANEYQRLRSGEQVSQPATGAGLQRHNPFALESKEPIPTKQADGTSEVLTGLRFGMLTVIGQSARLRSHVVVRCACGVYGLRRTKALLESESVFDCCTTCKPRAVLAAEIFVDEYGRAPTVEEITESLRDSSAY